MDWLFLFLEFNTLGQVPKPRSVWRQVFSNSMSCVAMGSKLRACSQQLAVPCQEVPSSKTPEKVTSVQLTRVGAGLLGTMGRVPNSHGLSSISYQGQLLAGKSFPSKLPICFWTAAPFGGHIQGRRNSFEPPFDGAGVTCKGNYPALDYAVMLKATWSNYHGPA